MSLRLMLGLLLSMPLLAIAAPPDYVHPFATVQPKNAPDEVRVVVEIPQGGFTKYEIGRKACRTSIASCRCRWPIPRTTARCRARWPAMAIRWMPWC